MAAVRLLQPIRKAGRLVYETQESCPLVSSGSAVGLWLQKGILNLAGYLDEDRQPNGGIEADVTYRVDPELGEVTIEATFTIEDDTEIYEWLEDPAMSVPSTISRPTE